MTLGKENMRHVIHTKQSLYRDLRESGIDSHGTLFVHSSMKAIGECDNRGDTVIDALIEFMSNGLLIMPTHTWDNIGADHNIFDPLTEPSCVGILTNLFMKRPGVIRSLHPTHSVAAIGKDAADYISGEEHTSTPCPRNGCYGKLYDRKAQILFLGCDLSKNTFLHGVEEWNNIPQRLANTQQELYIKLNDELLPCPQNRHHHPTIDDISQYYIKMEQAFIRTGIGKYCTIGDAHSILCDAVGMSDLVGRCLQIKPDLFINDRPVYESLYIDCLYNI